MDYPYINLDLLKEYAVCFYGHCREWANRMLHAVGVHDGESFQCCMEWNCLSDGSYFLRKTRVGYIMSCVPKNASPYPVITIEKLIEMSSSSDDYDFSNELQTLLDN